MDYWTDLATYWDDLLVRWQSAYEVVLNLWAVENTRNALILLLIALPIALVKVKRRDPGSTRGVAPHERKHHGTPGIERFLTWLKPPQHSVAFGHIVASFRWLPHIICFGAPGSGKSSFLQALILDRPIGLPALGLSLVLWFTLGMWPRGKRRGKLVITGNFSAPFRAAILWLIEHGFPACIWTPNPMPGEGFGLDVLEGQPDNVGERIIAMHPVGVGNTGLQSGAVEGMIVDTVYVLDRASKKRTFENILRVIPTVGVRDLDHHGRPTGQPRPLTTQEARGLENWCTRLRTLRRRLGASIGDDLKISEALANGWAVLIECSSYNNPNSTEPLINLFVYLTMWLVSAVGNFDLVIDEPGAVGPGVFTRLLTATRAKNVHIGIGMQSREQVDSKLREMCTTALLLGAAGGAPEARKFESEVTAGDIPPEDFVLLEPPRWYERLLFWVPRRGLLSCQGWFFSNGRLDKVQTPFPDLKILDRWPKGSVPTLKHRDAEMGEWESADRSAEAGIALSSSGTGQSGTAWEDRDGYDGESGAESGVAASESIVVLSAALSAEQRDWPQWLRDRPVDADRMRFWAKLRREREVGHIGLGCLRWLGGDNGEGRPKAHLLIVGEDGRKKKTSPTTYVVTYEWEHGKGSAKPSLDHLCHSYDETCPGNKMCDNSECENPMHPFGEPCQHGLCCETSHLEPVGTDENNQRRADQEKAYARWHMRWANGQVVERSESLAASSAAD